ncbi:Nn.00g053620.m01.CDS01 [Neocucurbitaria sp. VM-36]
MLGRPIFLATHPRSCSTAFERVFITRQDILTCVHEPFSDVFYYGTERLSERFADDELARVRSGFADYTYKTIVDRLERDAAQGKRMFIKDMAAHLFPPDGKPVELAPSLLHCKDGAQGNDDVINDLSGHSKTYMETDNPTVLPSDVLRQFHFTFLIRNPRQAIPSHVKCTIPPLADATGFHGFLPSEAGYNELRQLFDYLRQEKIIGPSTTGDVNGITKDQVKITVIDADDLLDNPEGIFEAFCKNVGVDFTPDMMTWGSDEEQKTGATLLEKWKGFHIDAIKSTGFQRRSPTGPKISTESEYEMWGTRYGVELQKVIQETVEACVPDYEYLKQFSLHV